MHIKCAIHVVVGNVMFVQKYRMSTYFHYFVQGVPRFWHTTVCVFFNSVQNVYSLYRLLLHLFLLS